MWSWQGKGGIGKVAERGIKRNRLRYGKTRSDHMRQEQNKNGHEWG